MILGISQVMNIGVKLKRQKKKAWLKNNLMNEWTILTIIRLKILLKIDLIFTNNQKKKKKIWNHRLEYGVDLSKSEKLKFQGQENSKCKWHMRFSIFFEWLVCTDWKNILMFIIRCIHYDIWLISSQNNWGII